jgi:phytoene synthase
MTVDVEEAYDAREEIVRTQARNFSYGISALTADKRRALSAVYAFARRVDDVGDGELPTEERLRLLARAAANLPWRRSPDPLDQVLAALADANERFALPRDPFDDLIDGVRSDVRPAVFFVTTAELVLYCRRWPDRSAGWWWPCSGAPMRRQPVGVPTTLGWRFS